MLFDTHAHRDWGQGAEGVIFCVADGKVPGAVRKIGFSSGSDGDGREGLSGGIPVHPGQQFPSDFVSGSAVQKGVS